MQGWGVVAVLGLALMAGAGGRLWQMRPAAPGPGPEVVRLEPRAFVHRLHGDWRREGRPVDAPRAEVRIAAPVWLMAYPVGAEDYMACVAEGACAAPDGPVAAGLPVTGVSWIDANAYAVWLSRRTGQAWRLPTDEEWAQGAGDLFRDDALGIADDPGNPAVRWLAEYEAEAARSKARERQIRPAGTLNRSETGMHDIGGAVWEWTATCLRQVDVDAGGAVLNERQSCGVYIAEGLHRAALTAFVRDPKSGGCSVGVPPDNMGFRLVREGR